MKRVSMTGLLQVVAFLTFGQDASGISDISVNRGDKILLVESSIDIPSWHEKNFWSLYDKYESVNGQVSSSSIRVLNDLAKIDIATSENEALDHAKKLIAYRYEQFNIKSKYFEEMGSAFNGVIAFQFLQTETILDIMECAKVYEQTSWRNFRFQPKALAGQSKSAKYNIIKTALSLPSDKADQFYEVYRHYEAECDAILGEDYTMYSLFSGEPEDFTPALAKRSGQNLLTVMKRELKLKEKYFNEMNKAVGPSIASRFLAWEDYYSLTSKMIAWSENP